MTRFGLLIVLCLSIAPSLARADSGIMDSLLGFAPPAGYEQAWDALVQSQIATDPILYRMMQQGRGISKGDRVALVAAHRGDIGFGPLQLPSGVWLLAFHTYHADLSSQKLGTLTQPIDAGKIYLLLSEVPKAIAKTTWQLIQREHADYWQNTAGIVFGRYQGVADGVPVLSVDLIVLPRVVFDAHRSQVDLDATLPMETISSIGSRLGFWGR